MKLTDAQMNIALDILRDGKCELSKDSSQDYIKAAAFVFDGGFMHYPLKDVRAALASEQKP